MLSRFHYGTTHLYVSMSALYLEDLHDLIAEMIVTFTAMRPDAWGLNGFARPEGDPSPAAPDDRV